MQPLEDVSRTPNRPCKPSTFALVRTVQLSSSPNLLFVFASGYINTIKQFLFLKYVFAVMQFYLKIFKMLQDVMKCQFSKSFILSNGFVSGFVLDSNIYPKIIMFIETTKRKGKEINAQRKIRKI